jgi:hypothetical protein
MVTEFYCNSVTDILRILTGDESKQKQRGERKIVREEVADYCPTSPTFYFPPSADLSWFWSNKHYVAYQQLDH